MIRLFARLLQPVSRRIKIDEQSGTLYSVRISHSARGNPEL